MTTRESHWRKVGEECGWNLPRKAAWPYRLPVIRHVRAAILWWKMENHYAVWDRLGGLRTGYDEWVLYAIARGWC